MGRLFVVATPIGNLEDITYRAVRVLREVQLILAEDTRHTRKLLARYAIHARLLSYHQHNKFTRLNAALRALETSDVALVSSAGMPSISDPGFELIRAAVDNGVAVTVLPGASAVLTAVVGAAIPAPGFLFLGFPPRRRSERRARLSAVEDVSVSVVLYESPHRVPALLDDLAFVLGDRRMVLARELTKIHEEYLRGSVREVMAQIAGRELRGECTLVVGPAEVQPAEETDDGRRETLIHLREGGADRRTALAAVMAQYGISRNEAYQLWLEVTADVPCESPL